MPNILTCTCNDIIVVSILVKSNTTMAEEENMHV